MLYHYEPNENNILQILRKGVNTFVLFTTIAATATLTTACVSSNVSNNSNSTEKTQEEPVEAEKVEVKSVAETPEPSVTPEPTPESTPVIIGLLTPEEKAANELQKEVDQLKYYWDTYEDMSALVFLEVMYIEGEITKEQYGEKYSAIASELSSNMIEHYQLLSDILNGTLEELEGRTFSDRIAVLVQDIKHGILDISLFKTQEKRDRFENNINLINKWVENPNDLNTKAMEESITDSNVTAGERLFIQLYVISDHHHISKINVDGKEYTLTEYLAKRIIDEENNLTFDEYTREAMLELRDQNNTPNPEPVATEEPDIVAFSTQDSKGKELSFVYIKA